MTNLPGNVLSFCAFQCLKILNERCISDSVSLLLTNVQVSFYLRPTFWAPSWRRINVSRHLWRLCLTKPTWNTTAKRRMCASSSTTATTATTITATPIFIPMTTTTSMQRMAQYRNEKKFYQLKPSSQGRIWIDNLSIESLLLHLITEHFIYRLNDFDLTCINIQCCFARNWGEFKNKWTYNVKVCQIWRRLSFSRILTGLNEGLNEGSNEGLRAFGILPARILSTQNIFGHNEGL